MGEHVLRMTSKVPALVLTALLLAVACSRETTGPVTTPSPPTVTSSPSIGPGGGTWTTYHGDAARSGVAVGGPSLRDVQRSWTSPQLDGDVYAEPLAIGSHVIAATENNSVYALDAASGAIVWHANLGTPVDASSLPCGNIQPTSGITATPVADPATGVLYVAAFLSDGPTHELFALREASGEVFWHRPVDPDGMDPETQQLRSALTLANDRVYVAYGGLFGDCGSYHGWVAALPADGDGPLIDHQVPTANAGGIWAPSGAAVDADGNLYVATGNSFGDTYDFGDSVLKLSATLERVDSFAPSNWAELDAADADLGSVGPAVLPGDRLFQIGKEGVGYLLSSTDLGGIGGELFATQLCGSSFGGTAHTEDLIFVPCTDGLVALRVAADGGRFDEAWRADGLDAGPPIVAGGLVWTVDESSGSVIGFEPETGREVVRLRVDTVSHFPSPSSAPGCLFVPTLRTVTAFCVSS
jgi:outer membrane protein assembly factor BamB